MAKYNKIYLTSLLLYGGKLSARSKKNLVTNQMSLRVKEREATAMIDILKKIINADRSMTLLCFPLQFCTTKIRTNYTTTCIVTE